MKKTFVLFLLSFSIQKFTSQIVFCPPGAEWHYYFNPGGGVFPNEEIKYIRDSIVNGETVKVLKHTRFYFEWNVTQTSGYIFTLVKQNGDTIFMKNPGTQGKWQILYNFAALPGQSWQNKIGEIDSSWNIPPGTELSYTVVVDSVKSVLVNNFPLKKLFVRYISDYLFPPLTQNAAHITERLGCYPFMFFYSHGYSETHTGPDIIGDFLCYKDNTFGLKQFTNHNCDYSNVGINTIVKFNNGINVFPNPSKDKISFDIPFQDDLEITIYSMLGSEILRIKNYQNLSALDVLALKDGVYFYKVQTKTNNYKGKFIKG